MSPASYQTAPPRNVWAHLMREIIYYVGRAQSATESQHLHNSTHYGSLHPLHRSTGGLRAHLGSPARTKLHDSLSVQGPCLKKSTILYRLSKRFLNRGEYAVALPAVSRSETSGLLAARLKSDKVSLPFLHWPAKPIKYRDGSPPAPPTAHRQVPNDAPTAPRGSQAPSSTRRCPQRCVSACPTA